MRLTAHLQEMPTKEIFVRDVRAESVQKLADVLLWAAKKLRGFSERLYLRVSKTCAQGAQGRSVALLKLHQGHLRDGRV
jgi:hypothetical protein